MTSDVLAAYAVTIAALVSAVISTIVKPLIESLPFANPNQPGYIAAAHDALLRAANVLLNCAGVAIMAITHGQLSVANWLPLALQIFVQALGSHSLYNTIKNPSPALATTTAGAPSPQVVAAAMTAAMAATERPAASFSVARPNGLVTPADPPDSDGRPTLLR